MSQTSEHPRPQPPVVEESAARRVLGLVAVVAAVVLLSLMTGSFPIVAFVLALVASIMIHETGHYVAAKWAGMKVTEYFVGFGPRLWSVRKGETEYGVKAIPAGGYVKVIGMSNAEKGIDPADEPRTYRQASYPKRVIMVMAGIFTHFLIAFVLLILVWTVIGVPRDDRPTLQIAAISRLESGPSPAQQAGLQVGDRIVSVDGQPITNWRQLPPYIRERPGRQITFVVERDGQQRTLQVVPADSNPEGEAVGFVGISPRGEVEKVNPVLAAGRSVETIGRLSVASVKALGGFFSPGSLANYGDQLTGSESDEADDSRPVSVIGVARIAGQAALFEFMGLLITTNIFLGIVNAVPLPPLDGGHFAIATYERIRSRKGKRYHADVQKLLPVAAAVLVLIITLGATSIWLDIVRPISSPLQ